MLENIDKRVVNASPRDEVVYQDEADVHLTPRLDATCIKLG